MIDTESRNGSGMDLQQAEAIAKLPPDLMLLKMENESIMAVARAAPRDPFKVVGQLQQLIDAYPAAADDAIYSKPVGTVIEVTCGGCGVKYEVTKIEPETRCPACDSGKYASSRKVKKFAEGLSIRAAESIRSIYGYTRLATTTEILDDGRVKITGVLVDYAAGNVTSDERIVSPMYKSRGGRMERTPEDRFLNVVVKSEKAKLRRDVILDNTPNIVKAMFRDACEKKLEELVAPEVIEQKIIPAFAQYGITVDHLEKIVGRSKGLGWRENERLELRKILTALKNEETTVRELLDGLDPPKQAAAAQSNAVSVNDLLGTGGVKTAEVASSGPTFSTEDRTLYLKEIFGEAASLDDVRALLDKLKGPEATEDWSEFSELIEQFAKAARERIAGTQAASSTSETEWPELARLRGALLDRQSEKTVVTLREAWKSSYPAYADAIQVEADNRIAQLKEQQKQQELIK